MSASARWPITRVARAVNSSCSPVRRTNPASSSCSITRWSWSVARQAVQERLHLGDLALHALDQLLQALGRVVAEEVAVPLHEGLEIGVAAPPLLFEHLVQVGRHLLDALQVLGRQGIDRPGEVL